MIVYNITLKVEKEIDKEWLEWQRSEHIPEIMATGLFESYNFFRLLEQDDSEGPTYILQYHTSSLQKYQSYIKSYAPSLREKANEKWKQRFVAFRTLMESVY